MSRIDSTFAELRERGRKAFIAYVCAGDPSVRRTHEVLDALVDAGVDVIELGVPFSDPLADGIVNQMAAQRALEAGATVGRVLEIIREFRERSSVPIVLFTYLNPIYAYGYGRFHEAAAAAGADGILLLDLPPDEIPYHRELSGQAGLQHIVLVAPTSSEERIAAITRDAEGFIYYVSREGVTGEQSEVGASVGRQVAAIRSKSSVPVAVGFGISTPEQAAEVAAVADGVVVGSAIVRAVGKHGDADGLGDAVRALVKPLVAAVKSA